MDAQSSQSSLGSFDTRAEWYWRRVDALRRVDWKDNENRIARLVLDACYRQGIEAWHITKYEDVSLCIGGVEPRNFLGALKSLREMGVLAWTETREPAGYVIALRDPDLWVLKDRRQVDENVYYRSLAGLNALNGPAGHRAWLPSQDPRLPSPFAPERSLDEVIINLDAPSTQAGRLASSQGLASAAQAGEAERPQRQGTEDESGRGEVQGANRGRCEKISIQPQRGGAGEPGAVSLGVEVRDEGQGGQSGNSNSEQSRTPTGTAGSEVCEHLCGWCGQQLAEFEFADNWICDGCLVLKFSTDDQQRAKRTSPRDGESLKFSTAKSEIQTLGSPSTEIQNLKFRSPSTEIQTLEGDPPQLYNSIGIGCTSNAIAIEGNGNQGAAPVFPVLQAKTREAVMEAMHCATALLTEPELIHALRVCNAFLVPAGAHGNEGTSQVYFRDWVRRRPSWVRDGLMDLRSYVKENGWPNNVGGFLNAFIMEKLGKRKRWRAP